MGRLENEGHVEQSLPSHPSQAVLSQLTGSPAPTEELLATIYLTISDTGGRNVSLIHKDSINLPQQNLKKPNSIENCIWLNF